MTKDPEPLLIFHGPFYKRMLDQPRTARVRPVETPPGTGPKPEPPAGPRSRADAALRELGDTSRRTARWFFNLAANALNIAIAVGMVAIVYVGVRQLTATPVVTPPVPIPVVVAAVTEVPTFTVSERFAGRIEPRRQTAIAPERGGRIAEIFVDEGDEVAADAPILQLDTRALEAERDRIKAQVAGIDAQTDLAQIVFDRTAQLKDRRVATVQAFDEARIRLQELAASKREVEAALAAVELDIEKSLIAAPFAGRVTERTLDEGAILAAGTPVLTVIETAAPRLQVGLPDARARGLDTGDAVTVRYGGTDMPGKVIAVRPDVHAATQSVVTFVELSPPDGVSLRFGDTADLVLDSAIRGPGYVLPVKALAEGQRGLWSVYTVGADDVVGTEAVEIIAVAGGSAYVKGSLKTGQTVVVEGRHRVAPGEVVAPREAGAPDR